jgi:hypothetical protein
MTHKQLIAAFRERLIRAALQHRDVLWLGAPQKRVPQHPNKPEKRRTKNEAGRAR